MKLLHQCLVLGTVALCAVSCSQDAPWSSVSGDEGKISLKLATDFSVKTFTRADDTESPVKPDGESFRIKLENSDGSYVKEWESLAKFNDEEGFPKGTYTVTASYGSETEQGFANPHYVGTEQVTVIPDEVSNHSIIATLANSMVSVRYTDGFLKHFSNFSASLRSEGIADLVVFAKSEDRPAYVKPGTVTVNFNISNEDGREITVSPATFEAVPRRHYIVTADVAESEAHGMSVLKVIFDEEVDVEAQEIVLSEALFDTTPPEVTLKGCNSGDVINTYESVSIEVNPEFHIIAFGGIAEAKFMVETANGGVEPDFSSEVDLANTDEITQQLVEQSGLKCYGLFKKPGVESDGNQMAVINLKDFIEKLKPGEYKFSVEIKDGLGRRWESETPLSISAKVETINYIIEPDEAFVPKFLDKEVAVLVSTNYAGAKDKFTFMVENEDGTMHPAPIESTETVQSTDSNYPNKFRFILKTGAIDDMDWDVTVSYPNKNDQTVKLYPTPPDYKIEYDSFATKVMFKLIPENPDQLNKLVDVVRFYRPDGSAIDSPVITRDVNTGIFTLWGSGKDDNGNIISLEPGTEYNDVILSFGSSPSAHSDVLSFTTEGAPQVPNGDFEDLVETINTTINQGGRWTNSNTVFSPYYQTTLSMKVSEPKYWLSSNSLTCNMQAKNLNSWFVIPSVYNTSLKWESNQPEAKAMGIGQSKHTTVANIYSNNTDVPSGKNAMVVRNVAWDNNGATPADNKQTGNTDFSNYYCSNTPSSIANRSKGHLYLGEGASAGITFNGRPEVLKGYYKYLADAQDPDEKGVVAVKILSGNEVIATGTIELKAINEYTEFKVPLTYVSDIFNRKATSLQIDIYSSNNKEDASIKTTNYCNKEECCSRGASLFVDDLKFDY